MLGVLDGLALGSFAYEFLTGGCKPDNRGCSRQPLLIPDNSTFVSIHDRHAGVGGAEVDTQNVRELPFRCMLNNLSDTPKHLFLYYMVDN